MAQLVVITGPIAAGKSTVASLIADALAVLGRSAVLVDVDDVASMVAGPGAAVAGLWFAAHQAHGALVGKWMQTAVDVVIAVGPIYTAREQAALLEPLPEASAVHWVVIDAPLDVTLARAQAEPGRGRSREPEFHRAAHHRFRQLLHRARDQTSDRHVTSRRREEVGCPLISSETNLGCLESSRWPSACERRWIGACAPVGPRIGITCGPGFGRRADAGRRSPPAGSGR
jgi:shikimate kinase